MDETISGEFLRRGEHFAAGLSEINGASPIARFARAYRRWFENCPLPAYSGGGLYPAGKQYNPECAVMKPSYSFTLDWDRAQFERRAAAASPGESTVLDRLSALYQAEAEKINPIQTVHTIGGAGYTHAIVNYGRVLAEGLDGYAKRLAAGRSSAADAAQGDFYLALEDLLEGIRAWHQRLLAALSQSPVEAPEKDGLIAALRQVPFQPARNFYEAVVSYNLIYFVDGCDNPGRMEQVLWPYYQDDPHVTPAQALETVREFFSNVCANGGWSLAIGGSNPDGSPAYQELTEIFIAAAHHKYRPSLELRVRPDMPEAIWDLSWEALSTGCGQPAFYNEPAYLAALRGAGLGIRDADIVQWNGGGCTETMLHGCSNVGSLDAGLNLPLVLAQTLERVLAREGVTFGQVLQAYKDDLQAVVRVVANELNAYFAERARHRPQPVRSLLMDDCIERGQEFNAGGARYNWSVVNVAGLANVADSLEALREVVFERKEVTPSGLLAALRDDFGGNEALRQRLLHCAKFGNDIHTVDMLAAELGGFVYGEILAQDCQRGGKFLPAHIMFETFATAGSQVGATPDGRHARQPLSDSSGPVQGRDGSGPTAMLKSVANLPLHLAAGTPVLNISFSKKTLAQAESQRHVRALVETYFKMGGMQIQVSVLDREELLDALTHPELHENLMVRIGGYSTYFNWLSPELKQEVIQRTEYIV
jgi:pyruvate-formate lyase